MVSFTPIRAMYKETAPDMLKGIIEADETYVVVKTKIVMPIRKNNQLPPCRGGEDKTPVVVLLSVVAKY